MCFNEVTKVIHSRGRVKFAIQDKGADPNIKVLSKKHFSRDGGFEVFCCGGDWLWRSRLCQGTANKQLSGLVATAQAKSGPKPLLEIGGLLRRSELGFPDFLFEIEVHGLASEVAIGLHDREILRLLVFHEELLADLSSDMLDQVWCHFFVMSQDDYLVQVKISQRL